MNAKNKILPRIETLEARDVPSGPENPVKHISSYDFGSKKHVPPITRISYDKGSGLSIIGTEWDDRVSITEGVSKNKPVVKFNATVIYKNVYGRRVSVVERFELAKSESYVGTLPAGQRIWFEGKGGDDYFRYFFPKGSPGMNVFANGGTGMDELWGGPKDDILVGGDNADHLSGLGGNDLLIGGAGNDRLKGEKGNDILVGGVGKDTLDGGDDDDVLAGGKDLYSDGLFGGKGRDTFETDWFLDDNLQSENLDTPAFDAEDPRPSPSDPNNITEWSIAVDAGLSYKGNGSAVSIVMPYFHRTEDGYRLAKLLDSFRGIWGNLGDRAK